MAAGVPCSPFRSATPHSTASRARRFPLQMIFNCSIFDGNHCSNLDGSGQIRTHELREPRAYYGINKGIKSGDVIRIKNGVYMLPEELATTMVDVERIVPGGVVCMYSAWDYYGLTTQIPDGFYVAIEKHRKVVAPEISGIVLCYWEEKYCTMGVEETEIANHRVKIFCIEKSVCDAVKFRNKIGTEVAVEVLRNYLKRKDRNISRLMDYAKQMRVLSTMRQYLEMGL